jgi:hypothetical protein
MCLPSRPVAQVEAEAIVGELRKMRLTLEIFDLCLLIVPRGPLVRLLQHQSVKAHRLARCTCKDLAPGLLI